MYVPIGRSSGILKDVPTPPIIDVPIVVEVSFKISKRVTEIVSAVEFPMIICRDENWSEKSSSLALTLPIEGLYTPSVDIQLKNSPPSFGVVLLNSSEYVTD